MYSKIGSNNNEFKNENLKKIKHKKIEREIKEKE